MGRGAADRHPRMVRAFAPRPGLRAGEAEGRIREGFAQWTKRPVAFQRGAFDPGLARPLV